MLMCYNTRVNAIEQKPVGWKEPGESCRLVRGKGGVLLEFILLAVRWIGFAVVGCNGCSRYRAWVYLYLKRPLSRGDGKLRWYHGIFLVLCIHRALPCRNAEDVFSFFTLRASNRVKSSKIRKDETKHGRTKLFPKRNWNNAERRNEKASIGKARQAG